jgi:hypothetical protein
LGNTAWTFVSDTVTADVTLYAKWTVTTTVGKGTYNFLAINSTAFAKTYDGIEVKLPGSYNAANTYASMTIKVVFFGTTGTELANNWGLGVYKILDTTSTDWATGVVNSGYNVNETSSPNTFDSVTKTFTIDLSAVTDTNPLSKLVLQNGDASVGYIGLVSVQLTNR